jgi:type I restriction enzyme S subunit
MKSCNIHFSNISKDKVLRVAFRTANLSKQADEYFERNASYMRLKDIFSLISGYAFKSEDYTQFGVALIRIGNLNESFDFTETARLPFDYYNDFSKYQIRKNDILVSLTGDGRLKILFWESGKGLLNQRVGALRAKNDIEIKFYYYLLRSRIVKQQYLLHSNGKTQMNISPTDFLNIAIPIVAQETQSFAMKKIRLIEKEICVLKDRIQSPQSIIDEVFAREFEFDYEKFEELKKHTRYEARFSAFANNPDLRFSVKFHCDAGAFVMEQLTAITNKKIKHFLSEPIVLGTSVSPSDYSDDGDYYYISMATIKSWSFDAEGANLLKGSYVNGKQKKTVRKNDILLARSGEGTIGKVALIDSDDVQGVFADFTMRIRLANYNPLFAYYYFRTAYFQYLVEIYKKGLGNNTNIFPIVVREFPIPDVSLAEQQRIVDEIKAEIGKQDNIKDEIFNLRAKIDAVIESALS